MSQHLVDDRKKMSGLLKAAKEHEHEALCKKYGWRLIDIKHSCGVSIKDYLVDTRGSIEDDLRVRPCRSCGGRGNWTHAHAVKKAKAPEPVKVEVSKDA